MKKIKVISYTVTLGIMALIFFFSSQNSNESDAVSHGLIMSVLNFISSFVTITQTDKLRLITELNFFVRKLAHFTIYMCLGCSMMLSVRLFPQRDYKLGGICTAMFCMCYAITDEIHQWFVGGRSARAGDVCIDTLGAVTGIFIFLIIRAVLNKRKNYKEVIRQ